MRAGIVLFGILLVAVAACSSGDSMPESFNGMASDEVGCTVRYGDDPPYVVGPLGASGSENIEPNDYTFIRIGRTASDIVVVAEVPGGGQNGSTPLNNMPEDGVIDVRAFYRGDDPGFVVTCWRGDT